MGSMIVVDQWLSTMAEKKGHYATVATKLLRTQILVANRLGHEIPLSTEYLRRRILHAARYGSIAECTVLCAHCGTQATLTNWVAVADLDLTERRAAWRELRQRVDKERLSYMLPCPGEGYRSDVARTDALPGVGKRYR